MHSQCSCSYRSCVLEHDGTDVAVAEFQTNIYTLFDLRSPYHGLLIYTAIYDALSICTVGLFLGDYSKFFIIVGIYWRIVNCVGFAISSGIDVSVVKLRASMRKKLCRVLALHHLTGGTEENYKKPHVSGSPSRTLQWEARILTSERRYSVFVHIWTLSDPQNLNEVGLTLSQLTVSTGLETAWYSSSFVSLYSCAFYFFYCILFVALVSLFFFTLFVPSTLLLAYYLFSGL